MIHGQPPDRGLGQGPCRPGQAAIEPGGPLGRERRVAGQQLIGAVAAKRHLDLVPRKAAQQVRGQDRRIAERLIEPDGHLGQELVNLGHREGPLVVVGAEMIRHQSGLLALIKVRLLEPDRESVHVPGRLDLAERRGNARGIDAS